jgi:hypothetical protein
MLRVKHSFVKANRLKRREQTEIMRQERESYREKLHIFVPARVLTLLCRKCRLTIRLEHIPGIFLFISASRCSMIIPSHNQQQYPLPQETIKKAKEWLLQRKALFREEYL